MREIDLKLDLSDTLQSGIVKRCFVMCRFFSLQTDSPAIAATK
jgi:hypothetical protein